MFSTLLVDEVFYDDGHVTIKTMIPLVERQLHPINGGIQDAIDANTPPFSLQIVLKASVVKKKR